MEQRGDLRREMRPRRSCCEHLDHRAADRPDVGRVTVACLLDHFRSHPVRRSTQRAASVAARQVGLQHLRRAEVGELAHAQRVNEHVGTLDVTVHDATGVQVPQSLR